MSRESFWPLFSVVAIAVISMISVALVGEWRRKRRRRQSAPDNSS